VEDLGRCIHGISFFAFDAAVPKVTLGALR
jgi:hypothetical protein